MKAHILFCRDFKDPEEEILYLTEVGKSRNNIHEKLAKKFSSSPNDAYVVKERNRIFYLKDKTRSIVLAQYLFATNQSDRAHMRVRIRNFHRSGRLDSEDYASGIEK